VTDVTAHPAGGPARPDEAAGRADGVTRLAILEAFADASSDALFVQDADGRLTAWNQSAERMFGYREDELLGETVAFLFPTHLQAEVKSVFDTVAAGERVDHFETEAERKLGMPVPISLSLRPVLDEAGAVTSIVLVAQDLTERRLGQATLAEVEARLRGGEAQVHVGRWVWDVGTGAVQWSDELHRIHGVDPLEFGGTLHAHLLLIHPDDRQFVRTAMEVAVSSGRPFEAEYRVVRPDGEERWIYARAEPTIGSADVVVALRGIGQDVTDQRPPPEGVATR
jgi:PAS domain S-box-containing protein